MRLLNLGVPMSEMQATEAALDLLSTLVLEDGRRWGEAALPWQWADAMANLTVGSETPYHFQTRPRGASKTADQAGVLLAVMLTQAPHGGKLYAVAADRDQGALIVESMMGYVRRTPVLEGLLEISAFKVNVIGTGVALEVLAADAAGAWGLRPYYVSIDELAQWAETTSAQRLLEAVRTAVTKMSARMVITTTAGDPAHFAYAIRAHALEDPLWRVHEVAGPVPWQDPAVLAEQERALPPASFRRLFLNEWVDAADRLATLESLRRCAVLDGPLPPQRGLEYVIGVDLGLKHDRTAVAICHAVPTDDSADGLGPTIVLDRLEVWSGSPDRPVSIRQVFNFVVNVANAYGAAKVVVDPYQAASLAQELWARGLRVEEFTFTASSNATLATTLYGLIAGGCLQLPDDAELINELSRVRLRETAPNVLRLDHDRGQHDDRAIAIALAAQDLIAHPPGSGPRLRVLR
jgi:phage terminase large subunit-like protein